MDKTEERRAKIPEFLYSIAKPVNGQELASKFGVSRQVIVQDIAILKNRGLDIISTNRGYTMVKEKMFERVFKVMHGNDKIEEELNAIVDLGAIVKDVYVLHKVYGKIAVNLDIKSRRDVKKLIEGVESGTSKPLNHLTQGWHYHTVLAKEEYILDEVENSLSEIEGFYLEAE